MALLINTTWKVSLRTNTNSEALVNASTAFRSRYLTPSPSRSNVLLCILWKNGQFYPHKRPYSNSNISLLHVTRPRLQVILFSARNYHLCTTSSPRSGANAHTPFWSSEMHSYTLLETTIYQGKVQWLRFIKAFKY
jgi:hypothetical protein